MKSNQQIATKVSIVTIIGNVILSLFKLYAGVFAKSGAMISDAVHSASDVFSTLIVILGVKMASKESDKEHPYGHERMECVAALVLAIVLGITGLGIGYSGILKIFAGDRTSLAVPGLLALAAAIISIISKEAMYWYTRAAAKKINSGALMADAWHHRSDALSSIGSMIGILGARLGLPVLDPIASVVICIFILKAAFDVFKDAIDKMMDKACEDEVVDEMCRVISRQEGVMGIDQIKTRLFADKIYVDIEIQADGEETLTKAHTIAQRTHEALHGTCEPGQKSLEL